MHTTNPKLSIPIAATHVIPYSVASQTAVILSSDQIFYVFTSSEIAAFSSALKIYA